VAKEYLGDVAYVEDGCMVGEIILTTSNGIEVTNTIHLGPSELESLDRFREAMPTRYATALAGLKENGFIAGYKVERDGNDIKATVMPFVPVSEVEVKIELTDEADRSKLVCNCGEDDCKDPEKSLQHKTTCPKWLV